MDSVYTPSAGTRIWLNRSALPSAPPMSVITSPPEASEAARMCASPISVLTADSASKLVVRRTGGGRVGGDGGTGSAVGIEVGNPGGSVTTTDGDGSANGEADGDPAGTGTSGGWLTPAGIGGSRRDRS